MVSRMTKKAHSGQEKLNESILVLNKTLQVCADSRVNKRLEKYMSTKNLTGNQRQQHERRACCTDVQELPIKCAV